MVTVVADLTMILNQLSDTWDNALNPKRCDIEHSLRHSLCLTVSVSLSFSLSVPKSKMSIVAHACNPSTLEAEQKDYKFVPRLGNLTT